MAKDKNPDERRATPLDTLTPAQRTLVRALLDLVKPARRDELMRDLVEAERAIEGKR